MSTVMVVDDEQRIIAFLSRALTAEGHTVRTACSGQAALNLLRDQPVDLMLLDLVMPQGNGLQVLGALRKREDTTPVIVLSGVADVAARVQALDRGAIDFVAKPFHTAELVARIRRHTVPVPHGRSGEGRYLTALQDALNRAGQAVYTAAQAEAGAGADAQAPDEPGPDGQPGTGGQPGGGSRPGTVEGEFREV